MSLVPQKKQKTLLDSFVEIFNLGRCLLLFHFVCYEDLRAKCTDAHNKYVVKRFLPGFFYSSTGSNSKIVTPLRLPIVSD